MFRQTRPQKRNTREQVVRRGPLHLGHKVESGGP